MPYIPGQENSYLEGLVHRVRAAVHDFPDETVSTVAMDTDTAVLTPPVEDRDKFTHRGIKIEWDDAKGEMAVTTAPIASNGTVAIRRARYGTTAQNHAAGVTVLIDPRFPFLRVSDAISDTLDGDFLPHIWVPGEELVSFQATNDYYHPDASDIFEVNFAYQLFGGNTYRLEGFKFTPADAVADEAYPNGLLYMPRGVVLGGEDFFISYKAKPTIFNLLTRQLGLAALGARASLMLDEEIEHVAPGRSAIRDRVQEGSKSNAGRTLRAQFLDRRDTERNVLLNHLAEQGMRFRATAQH